MIYSKYHAYDLGIQRFKADYCKCVEALQCRSIPTAKRQLAKHGGTELKNKNVGTRSGQLLETRCWCSADKAYPELAENARERLALNQFLEQIETPKSPSALNRNDGVTLKAAAVIEQESYLGSTGKLSRVSTVSSQEQESEIHHTVPVEPVSAVTSQDGRDSLTATMKSLCACERL